MEDSNSTPSPPFFCRGCVGFWPPTQILCLLPLVKATVCSHVGCAYIAPKNVYPMATALPGSWSTKESWHLGWPHGGLHGAQHSVREPIQTPQSRGLEVTGTPSATWSLWVTLATGIPWGWNRGHQEGCIQMRSEARACVEQELTSHTQAQLQLGVVLRSVFTWFSILAAY